MPEYYIQPVTNRQECYTCHKVVTGKSKLSKCAKCHAITYCSRECQVQDWPRHGWNCVPVMVTKIPGKGRGLVAAKDITMGELIFIDKPVIEVNGTKWKENRVTEAMIVMEKIENLPSEAKLQFYRMKGYGSSFTDLQKSEGKMRATVDVLLKNSRIVNQEDFSFSLYLNMALVNHSCSPNADVGKLLLEKDEAGKQYNRIEIRALKNISKGEEITYSYFGNLNKICCSSEERKMFVKEGYGFDCYCSVCSGHNMDQENIASELFDLLQTVPAPDSDHYRKDLSEWARDAENLDRINDLIQELQLGNSEVKWRSMVSLAKTAQLARNQNLVTKGLNMFKRFSGDIKIEEICLVYEKLERDLVQWSNNLKSKKTPRRNEIEFFLAKNLLSELTISTVHVDVEEEEEQISSMMRNGISIL